jgi:hypothetical protein
MRLVALTILLLIRFGIKSQDCSIIKNSNFILDDGMLNVAPILLPFDSTSIYAISASGIGKKTLTCKTGNTLLKKEYGGIKVNGEKRWPVLSFEFNKKLFLLYGEYQKHISLNVFYAYELDKQTLEITGEPKKLYEFTDENKSDIYAAFNSIQVAQFVNRGIVFWFIKDVENNSPVIQFYSCNQNLELVKSFTYNLQGEITQSITGPDGSIYLLMYSNAARSESGMGSPFKLAKFSPDGRSKKAFLGFLDNDLLDVKLIVSNKKEIVLGGYCAGEMDHGVTKLFKAVLDTVNLEMNHIQIMPVNIQNQKPHGEHPYNLKDVVFDSNENLYLIGEEFTETSASMENPNGGTIESITDVYGDLLVSCIHADKLEAGSIWIGKYQDAHPPYTYYASYLAKPCANGISVLYNDRVAGNFSNEKELSRKELNSTIIKLIQIDPLLQKSERIFTSAMSEIDKNEFPKGYTLGAWLNTGKSVRTKDGRYLLLSTAGPKKGYMVYVWE